MEAILTIKIQRRDLKSFYTIMQILFSMQDNATLLFQFTHLKSLEELFVSLGLNYGLKYKPEGFLYL